MQKSLYDQDTLTWSPQGRLYQVEYATEAVNQGNLLIGARSDNHVVLIGFKTAPNEKLSYFPEKLFKVSNHIGIGIAGLTPDGRLIYQYMKNQCLNYNYTFNADYPIEKLVEKISEKSQLRTQRGEKKRPYGVGLLIAGFDRTGPRLFRTCPSADFFEYNCVAIGSRCQAATSFLENNLEKLPKMSKDELWWYLKLREYGGCVHSGFGMGFERLIMYLTGVENIRDVIPYPRTPGNCTLL